MLIDLQQSVSKLLLDHAECAAVLQRYRIDFCCRGHLSLEAAATARHIDLGRLRRDLSEAIDEHQDVDTEDPRKLSTPALIDAIVTRHHRYLRRALPFARALASKVTRVHGVQHPELLQLQTAIEDLAATLLPHLDDEENTIFPELLANVHGPSARAQRLQWMQDDHLDIRRLLELIRSTANDFQLPRDACGSYRALFKELEHIEADTLRHIHLETHVLGPRFD